MRTRLFASAAARRAALVRLGLLAAVVAAAALAVRAYAPFLLDPEWIRSAVAGLGPYAAPAFVLVQALQVIFAPIPGQALGVVGGYLFGVAAGTAYSMLGVLAGSAVVFALARRYGRPFVERVVADDVLDRFDAFAESHGVVGLFVVFLLPTFPDDAVCALAGLTGIRLRTFLALVLVGRLPTFVLVALAGDEFASGRAAVAFGVLAAVALLSAVVYLARRRTSESDPA
ncbi:TVP38/TMEM64 family protein [Halogeometricum luteum]|uniref:TVP38/TMEM64 family protein n=1 Tax=Halogeometricum luteum TaxID=2950537 RepID=A0ABU2FZV0_9EURY|nr:TVP38/TMEM64 family protein [Halogeometricum sp. S3BR5-2]MDS0294052.1 TVP38/TMEM64 family protein [Halogeometricum sp. S3BR5-2]